MDNEAYYEIHIEGQLDERWARRFEGMTLSLLPNGDTIITGLVPDQAALHAILTRVRDIGARLISVRTVEDR